MHVLDFILGIVVSVIIFLTVIGVAIIKYDTQKLEKENEELKQKIRRKQLKEFKKNAK